MFASRLKMLGKTIHLWWMGGMAWQFQGKRGSALLVVQASSASFPESCMKSET
jgi:hypothetical protein